MYTCVSGVFIIQISNNSSNGRIRKGNNCIISFQQYSNDKKGKCFCKRASYEGWNLFLLIVNLFL